MSYIFLALMAMIFMGMVDFLSKMALSVGIGIHPLVFFVYLATAIFFGIYCLAQKQSLKIGKSLAKYPIIIGLFMVVGTFLAMTALKYGNASVVTPIVRMGFVVTAICAFIFLHEKITVKKGVGILFAVISLIFLSL